MMFHPTVPDAIGFAGSLLIVSLYWLSLNGSLRTTGLAYPALNLCGCLLILVSLYHNFNLPSVSIEVFWSMVSLYGIGRYFLRRGL